MEKRTYRDLDTLLDETKEECRQEAPRRRKIKRVKKRDEEKERTKAKIITTTIAVIGIIGIALYLNRNVDKDKTKGKDEEPKTTVETIATAEPVAAPTQEPATEEPTVEEPVQVVDVNSDEYIKEVAANAWSKIIDAKDKDANFARTMDENYIYELVKYIHHNEEGYNGTYSITNENAYGNFNELTANPNFNVGVLFEGLDYAPYITKMNEDFANVKDDQNYVDEYQAYMSMDEAFKNVKTDKYPESIATMALIDNYIDKPTMAKMHNGFDANETITEAEWKKFKDAKIKLYKKGLTDSLYEEYKKSYIAQYGEDDWKEKFHGIKTYAEDRFNAEYPGEFPSCIYGRAYNDERNGIDSGLRNECVEIYKKADRNSSSYLFNKTIDDALEEDLHINEYNEKASVDNTVDYSYVDDNYEQVGQEFFNHIVDCQNKYGKSFAQSFNSASDVVQLMYFIDQFKNPNVKSLITNRATFDSLLISYYTSCATNNVEPQLNKLFVNYPYAQELLKESERLASNLHNGKGKDYTIPNEYYKFYGEQLYNMNTGINISLKENAPLIDIMLNQYACYRGIGNMVDARKNQKTYDLGIGTDAQFACPDSVDDYMINQLFSQGGHVENKDNTQTFSTVFDYIDYECNGRSR